MAHWTKLGGLFRRSGSVVPDFILGKGWRGRRPPDPPAAGLPDWAAWLGAERGTWEEARRRAATGPRVLIATSVGGFSALTMMESLIAVALTLRGARVETLLCDHALPACLRAEKPEVPDPLVIGRYELGRVLCERCFATGQYIYAPLGLPGHTFTALLQRREREDARRIAHEVPFGDIPHYRFREWALGEHAYAGALRYFASGNLSHEPHGGIVLRRYLESALLTAFAVDRLVSQDGYVAACFNHGIYAPPGIIGEVCRQASVRVVNWNVAYRQRCFIFSHGDTYHHTLLSEPTSVWEAMPWTGRMEEQIADYLKSRWSGTRDWIWFHEKPDEAFDAFAQRIGLDLARPIIGLLTNVMWDAQLHYRANAFPDMLTWAVRTIEYFAQRPDLQLLIRIHPAEIRGTMPSRQPILPELRRHFRDFPPNVFVIPPESPVSTYAAMLRCDAAIIYGTKTGVELTSLGIPVIVGGEAWIRNKGLTLDASSSEEYFRILDSLPVRRRNDPGAVTRARKYAYHFFFRRMIPVACMEPASGWPPYRIAFSKLDDLRPGRDPGLDVICDGILTGTPFIYEAETHGVHDA
jgi:hypothetical protein